MHYTEITLNEMQSALAGWEEVTGSSSTHEHVYQKVLRSVPNIVVMVYTSISKSNSVGRRKGQDAIRVCAVNLSSRQGWIKTTRVLRVNGWRANLAKAISSVTFQANKRIERELGREKSVATTKESQYHPCWTKCEDNEYCTEASDLDANKERYRRDTCPHCGSRFTSKNLMEVKRSDEQEIQFWKFRCPSCRSILIVFND